ncbi:hypothetical protein B0H16DRAFT_1484218 [Mycena metata]|uniref:Uncharacterized protein n=1 Tax=Mycena metata TaxID=1033252 RepID=A0AAD7GQ84_9AGAR|nr:hypothetical protein B0H16DRAFT_1484218 [Mycena metata]
MLGFPFEIFMLVLEHTCGTYFQHMKDFIDARSLIMSVCMFWHDVVLEHGQFWTQYHIMPGKRYVDILDWTSHFNNHPVDLTVTVHLDSTPLPLVTSASSRASHVGRLTIRETAVEAARHAGRCERLHITGHEITALPTFMECIRDSDGAHLDVLSTARIVSSDVNAVEYHKLAHPIFGSHLPRLRFIRLLAFVLSWTELFYYPEAIYLVFHQVIGSSMIPTWRQLAAVLLSAPKLRRLSLRHFSCATFSGYIHRDVLASCRYSPTSVVQSPPHQRDVFHFVWALRPPPRYRRHVLLLAQAGAPKFIRRKSFVHRGLDSRKSGQLHFALLREVSVGDCPLRLIADFVWFRKVLGSPIDLLNIHDLPDFDLPVESWIAEDVGEMVMDPPYDFRDAWIWHNY